MSEAAGVLRVDCLYCYKPIKPSLENTTAVHFKGPDKRRLLDYFAVHCTNRETCPGFMLLFVRALSTDIVQSLGVVTTEVSYGEPDENVIDLFVCMFGYRPHIGNGVPVKELSLADLRDPDIAAAISRWDG